MSFSLSSVSIFHPTNKNNKIGNRKTRQEMDELCYFLFSLVSVRAQPVIRSWDVTARHKENIFYKRLAEVHPKEKELLLTESWSSSSKSSFLEF